MIKADDVPELVKRYCLDVNLSSDGPNRPQVFTVVEVDRQWQAGHNENNQEGNPRERLRYPPCLDRGRLRSASR